MYTASCTGMHTVGRERDRKTICFMIDLCLEWLMAPSLWQLHFSDGLILVMIIQVDVLVFRTVILG